jgi:hypothetical protein
MENEKYTIYTNNNVVAEFFGPKKELNCTIKWVAAPAIDVLTAARVLIRQGAVLMSNPLVGISSPPTSPTRVRSLISPSKQVIVNPYLSVLTSEPFDTVNFHSIKGIDSALTAYKKNAKLRFIAHNDDAVKHFQLIDLRSIVQTLSAVLKRDITIK